MVMRLLAALERRRLDFGDGAAAFRLDGLRQLARARLRSAAAVRRLHELLCFIRAYPDNAAVQTLAARLLDGFAQRADLRAHAKALANTGIAGTPIHFRFFAGQAQWLAAHWPQQLSLDRSDREGEARIAQALTVLLTHAEGVSLREVPRAGFATLDRLRNPQGAETDATFLLRRIAAMPGNGFTREAFCDAIDASYTLAASPSTPSRSIAFWPKAPLAFRREAPPRTRPDLRAELQRPPRRIRRLSVTDGQALVDLARAAMVTRERSLEAFSFADPRDAWLVDDGDGLAFAFAGVVPERRHAVFSYVGAITLRNGVPIGYTQADVLGTGAALSFNTFESFRGAEAAFSFARWLAALHALLGCAHFTIEPYQLGDHNSEAIESGAWWFYAKLGFVPRDGDTLRLMQREQARLRRHAAGKAAATSGGRTPAATLARLARHHLYFDVGDPRPLVTPAMVGDAIGAALSARGARMGDASNREQAIDDAVAELDHLCAPTPPRGPTAERSQVAQSHAARSQAGTRAALGVGPREAWRRLAPLLLMLEPQRWPQRDRQALAELAHAKGGRSERGFVAAWQAHPRLDAALLNLFEPQLSPPHHKQAP